MLGTLASGGAKVVGNLVFYSEPQIDPGLAYIEKLRATYRASGTRIPALGRQLEEARRALDTDTVLAASMGKADNVILPMTFDIGEPQGNPDAPLPAFIVRNGVDDITWPAGEAEPIQPPPARGTRTPPIPKIGEQAIAIGHLNQFLTRTEAAAGRPSSCATTTSTFPRWHFSSRRAA